MDTIISEWYFYYKATSLYIIYLKSRHLSTINGNGWSTLCKDDDIYNMALKVLKNVQVLIECYIMLNTRSDLYTTETAAIYKFTICTQLCYNR